MSFFTYKYAKLPDRPLLRENQRPIQRTGRGIRWREWMGVEPPRPQRDPPPVLKTGKPSADLTTPGDRAYPNEGGLASRT